MLRIETTSDGQTKSIRLIGRMREEHLGELRRVLETPRVVFDLAELTLVDVEAVRFLNTCEKQGVELLNCARHIREWMRREDQ